MEINESLLRALLSTVGRQVFPPEAVQKIVQSNKGGKKQLAAYNLCDGITPQADIARGAGLDKGNLSRSLSRWVSEGIVVRIGADQTPLHLYPLPKSLKG